jgi:hypothetical protein
MNRPVWMPKYIWDPVTWITHAVIQLVIWKAGMMTGGTLWAAFLCSAALPIWIEREFQQGGIKSLDDYMDLLGPALVTVWAWVGVMT